MRKQVEAMYAFIAIDPADDTEGLIGKLMRNGQWVPFVGADIKRANELRPLAQQIATETGRIVKLLHFRERTEIETIMP